MPYQAELERARRAFPISSGVALALAAALAPSASAQCGLTQRESVTPGGVQGDDESVTPRLSDDGRYVAFVSTSTNLIPGVGDGNRLHVFFRDRATGALTLLSASASGTPGNATSFAIADVSNDGRFVVFDSLASNLVPGDTNGSSDVFLRDTQLGTIERVSTNAAGVQGKGPSYKGTLSGDGRFIVFSSEASNLVAGDTNFRSDTFLIDRATGLRERVSLHTNGTQGDLGSDDGEVSDDGRWVVFSSGSTTLVTGDTNDSTDVFLRDRANATTTRISVSSVGAQANGISDGARISADGRTVVYDSSASNLVTGDTNGQTDIFAYDVPTGITRRISLDSSGFQANDFVSLVYLSENGRFAVYSSPATNLVAGDTNGQFDVFHHDLVNGRTTRVSVSSAQTQGNSGSSGHDISGDGRIVGFLSYANNLIHGDTNGVQDVFTHELWNAPISFCPATANSTGLPAEMSLWGTPRISDGSFELVARHLPDQMGLFIAAPSTTQVPFGNGVLCLAGGIRRLGPPLLASGGTVRRTVDYSVPPASQITVGSTWFFQLWFRDPAAGGSAFNLSTGLGLEFCP